MHTERIANLNNTHPLPDGLMWTTSGIHPRTVKVHSMRSNRGCSEHVVNELEYIVD